MGLHRKITISFLIACLLGAGSWALGSQASAGGIGVPRPAKIDDVICLTGCLKLRETTPGGSVQVTGAGMDQVRTVSFAGAEGRIRQEPSTRTSGRLVVPVPAGARSGKLRAHGLGGAKSAPSSQVLLVGSRGRLEDRGDRVRVVDASVSPRKTFQYGRKKPTLEFVVAGGGAENDLRVDLVGPGGTVASSIYRKAVPTNSNQSVTWNGRGTNGKPVKNGQYRFVIRAANGTPAELAPRLRARSAKSLFTTSIYGYIFPVRGPHEYWDGIGAGRGHQGLDIGARCGTKVVAARGGRVYWNAYQAGGAGYYVVINVAGTGGQSHAYMHLTKKSPLKKGQFVYTGQKIGTVGLTGRTTGCHLHFEMWSKPGWYQGGTFLDPTRPVKRWDSYS
jgi:murein DD-endopeptidase MepM/ murein hydrolase activator NlpD